MCDDVQICNRCVREFLILARTWFAFGLPSKTGCSVCLQKPGVTTTKLENIGSTPGEPLLALIYLMILTLATKFLLRMLLWKHVQMRLQRRMSN
jgi:hypothetical protein